MTLLGLHRTRPAEQSGAAAVEFALVVPILVVLIFGIVEFSRAYNAKISLSGAAREGARVMAIESDQDAARDAVLHAAPTLWDPDDPPPNLKILFDPSDGCSPSQAVEVKVIYPLKYEIPLFGTGSFDLEGIGVMRCGG